MLGKKFIEGKQIYLREVRIGDVNDNYYKWLNNPKINMYLEYRYIPQSLETILTYVKRMDGNQNEVFLPFAGRAITSI